MNQGKNSTVFQHGTLALLVPGLFEGTLKIEDLLKKGNFGIGTADSLAGEMVILDGTPYQVTSEGKVNILSPEDKVPFATVHFEDNNVLKQLEELENISKTALFDQLVEENQLANVFAAIHLHGEFSYIKTRAVAKQEQPYPPLVEATRVQPEFEAQNINGDLIGYFAPEIFQGAAVSGFHVHFLGDERTFGGHVLDFKIKKATGSLQIFETLEQHFPIEQERYRAHAFKIAQLNADIEEAEH